ncbi:MULTISPECIES: UDP-glucose dehydrogenase family protein [Rhizobium/Agrobacterium group]|jgi:UDPglucose 6-dehydrogenase|uniref:UDP-glucose 6-dehydrogenase n=2 Tax=Rhizobium/Agrobacterium group TaxID=227290 RepID=A0AA92H7N8_RHIRH|nr:MULTISPECIES: UDP-glucose/GDP-mannose dehydrogenase family protein [Rhizobium/Agrobacterium group]KQZ92728.1 UDP-glucose 6-dehydrogenase [Rhizobium sp. Root564]PVE62856.1 UDP-glucose/GDP-mannose dehydrogenase family protein [Agrobacterium tumefaciens]PVE71399.1 UDP-glucose/GDP-mannose dehydrogenase family protein [Sphingomonas sp. TPD3009]MDD1500876.1 UDP-glucose/GDP-mannose dehydrogenase family protein [Agrobacterium sp. CNPSo 3708]PVE50908.1 UDP-glucose/GDP-mannose dehydrogenase family pr
MRIVMIGSGYVGLVSGACFADFGHDVICVDKMPEKIDALKNGQIPIFEPGLDVIVSTNAKAGRLSFTTDLKTAVADADVVFIAVGTPSRRGDGHADLGYVYAAAKEIAAAITGFTVIVTKSTVPVGTGDEVERIIREENPTADFAVVSNPEFLREGAAIDDFKRPDRIVVGLSDERARPVMTEVYRPLYLNQSPLLFTTRRTSELIKYAANAFLAMKITFINEIADLCEKVGGDVQDVSRGIGLDGRIGSKFLHAGPGYGGSCFPKDTLALAKTAQDYDSPVRLIEATISVNDNRKRAMGRKVIAAAGGDIRGKKVAVLGLTFKPNTDDMRDSPAITVIQTLQDAGAKVTAYDPEGMANAKPLIEGIDYAQGPYEAAQDAEALVIVTEWNQFRALDLARLKSTMKSPVLVDLRNIYRADEVTAHGFSYSSIGRSEQ